MADLFNYSFEVICNDLINRVNVQRSTQDMEAAYKKAISENPGLTIIPDDCIITQAVFSPRKITGWKNIG